MPPKPPYEERPDPPNAVQVEPTEGCNLRCGFCGLQGIREKAGGPYNFMTVDTAGILAQSIARAGWNPRVEFAMHGEPTLNKDLPDIVAEFRIALPSASLMLTTNGGGLVRKPGVLWNLETLFDAGINIVALDAYEGVNLAAKARAEVYATASIKFDVYEYPEQPEGNPHRRANHTERRLVFIRDISLPDVTTGTHAVLNNHCGAGAPPNDSAAGKRCAKPFRELSVRWDGAVAICCNDWRGVYKVGNVLDTPVEQLWASPAFKAARRKLYHGMRTFAPCRGCDALSYRVGLLPDRMGRDTLPIATPDDDRLITKATGGRPLTLPVLRPWEMPA